MDLTLNVTDKDILQIKAISLIGNDLGFVFQKSRKGYVFPVGGRIQFGESKVEAIKRELKEELNIDIGNDQLEFLDTIEYFHEFENRKYHELNFLFKVLVELDSNKELPEGFIFVNRGNLNDLDLRPVGIKDFLSKYLK
jgi:8-oxo-dGTP pyrophosphatase MutT (NUDIX family)